MRKTRIFFICILLTIVVRNSYGSSAGESVMPFLMLGGGARPAGMGDAFTAFSDDASAVYWNSAGLAQIEKFEITVSRFNAYQDIPYDFLLGSIPLKKGSLGFGLLSVNFGDGEKRDEKGLPSGSFSNSALGLNICYGSSLTNRLMGGYGMKVVSQSIGEKQYNAFALDGALMYNFSKNIKFGYSIQNIGPNVKGFELPVNLKVGMLTDIDTISYPTKIGLDFVFPIAESPSFAIGAEMSISEYFSARLGYNNKQDIKQPFTLGFGFMSTNIRCDFAYIPSEVLDDTFVLSVGFKGFLTKPEREIKLVTMEPEKNKTKEKTTEIYIEVSDIAKKPLSDVTIKITQNDKLIKRGLTNSEGACSIDNLPLGLYQIKIWKKGYIPKQTEVELSPDKIVTQMKCLLEDVQKRDVLQEDRRIDLQGLEKGS